MKNSINEHMVLKYALLILILGTLGLSLWRITYALSWFFGGIIGVLAFRLLCLDVSKLLRATPKNVRRLSTQGYLKRLVLYGATLGVSLRIEEISFTWTLLGLLVPKLTIYVLYVLRRIFRGIKCVI